MKMFIVNSFLILMIVLIKCIRLTITRYGYHVLQLQILQHLLTSDSLVLDSIISNAPVVSCLSILRSCPLRSFLPSGCASAHGTAVLRLRLDQGGRLVFEARWCILFIWCLLVCSCSGLQWWGASSALVGLNIIRITKVDDVKNSIWVSLISLNICINLA